MSDDRQKYEERPFAGFDDTSAYDGTLREGELYDAVLLGVKERNMTDIKYPGWKVIWGFDLTGFERIEAMTSTATGPDSTAGDWLVALLGKERYERRGTERITPSELANRACRVLVKFNEKGWPRIGGVFPSQSSGPAAAPPPAAGPSYSERRQPTATAEDFDDLPF